MASAAKRTKVESNGKQIEEDEFIKKIDQIQTELDKVNEQASEEILEVEKKINHKRQPLYSERAKLIMTINNFWLTTLRNHPALSSLISVKDHEVLQYMTNLEVDEFDDIKSGFKITLTFTQNPFFTNTKISKSIHVGESELKTQCDAIEWKEGQDFVTALAANEEQQAQLANGNGTGVQLPKSFMLWFTSTKSESMVELGEVLKDDLWPNPLQYFFANESFDDDDDEEPEEEEDEEDDEDEEGQEEGDEDLDEEEDGE